MAAIATPGQCQPVASTAIPTSSDAKHGIRPVPEVNVEHRPPHWHATLNRYVLAADRQERPTDKPLPEIYTSPIPTDEHYPMAKNPPIARRSSHVYQPQSSVKSQLPDAFDADLVLDVADFGSELEMLIEMSRLSAANIARNQSNADRASSSSGARSSTGVPVIPVEAMIVAQTSATSVTAPIVEVGVVPSLVGVSQGTSTPATASITTEPLQPPSVTLSAAIAVETLSLFSDPMPPLARPDIPQLPAVSFDVIKDADGWMKLFSDLSADIQRLLRCEKQAFIIALMMATAVCPSAWLDRETFVKLCLRNFQFASRKLLNDWAVTHTPICCFVLVMGCSGVNTGLMCVDWALRLYKQNVNHRLQTHLMEVWTYETDTVTESVGNLVTAELPSPYRVMRYQNVFNAPRDVMQFVDYPDAVRYICMGSTECNSISFANQRVYSAGKSGLHDHPSDSWFPWHEFIWKLVQMKGANRVVVLNELPSCKQQCDERTLTAMSGVPITVNATAWGHAERRRQIRTSPILGFAAMGPTMIAARDPRAKLPDDASWYPTEAARGTTDRPVTLRRYYCKLLVDRYRQAKIPSAFEQLTMDSLRIIYPNNSVMNANVDFYLMHLGLMDTPVRRIKEILPCVKQMDGDGRAATALTPPGQVQFCGANFHCTACTKAIQILGGCWHLPSMTEVTYQVLARALDAWFGAGQVTWYEWQHVPHHCDENCKHRSARPSHG